MLPVSRGKNRSMNESRRGDQAIVKLQLPLKKLMMISVSTRVFFIPDVSLSTISELDGVGGPLVSSGAPADN
jgi:hypothetical protein